MKIFLGDLVHTWEKVSLWTFPLNVGYMAAYARAMVPETLEIRLFKRPELMIPAIKAEKPDVVGLSHYVWNAHLNRLVFRRAKEANPRTITVGGGPNFTSANADEAGARDFFAHSPDCDFYVVNQGERGFAELLRRIVEHSGDPARLRAESVAGCLGNDLRGKDRVSIGETLDPLRDLDQIPSPYLSGSMDPFFDEPFVPIIETNRSCPYRCTFCAWGIGTGKLATFSDARVMAEIDYIGEHCTKSMNMFIGDANFGILDRDADFARRIRATHAKRGYPGHVGVQWNKTRPDRVFKAAREFAELSEVGASMQSLSPDVLGAIKRKNLPLEQVVKLNSDLRANGVNMTLFSELIVGLPNETWRSHIDANRTLIDIGAEVFNYNLHLLPGTEMDSDESRERYFKRTGWRLHDNAFGVYDGVKVFEGQEVVLETNAMSTAELRSFRLIHFLIQFMWSRKWYYDFLLLFRQAGIHPIDMIVRVADKMRADKAEIGDLYARFKADHDLENFSSYEDLCGYWSEDANLRRLRDGGYGKLNYVFTYEILFGHYEAFNELLRGVAAEAAATLAEADRQRLLDQCADVLTFSRALRISLTENMDSIVERKRQSFRFDLLAWRAGGYRGEPARISTSERYEYEFFLADRQKSLLERQLAQFRSHNMNLTLRKMSEEIGADDFFYRVRTA